MTERQAFIKAIALSPADDLPRLAFADWLEERDGMVECGECQTIHSRQYTCVYHNGGPYESRWERCPKCLGTGRAANGNAEQAERIRWMIDHPEVRWVCLCEHRPGEVCYSCRRIPGTRDIPRRAAPGVFGETPYVVHRGFISEVRCSLANFVGCAAELFREHPIERVVFTDQIPYPAHRDDNVAWYTNTRIGIDQHPDHVKWYTTRLAAINALSDRAVAFGRAAAWG